MKLSKVIRIDADVAEWLAKKQAWLGAKTPGAALREVAGLSPPQDEAGEPKEPEVLTKKHLIEESSE